MKALVHIGAHAKILMFVHVSPEGDNLAETVNTLKVAQKASTVELGAGQSKKTNNEVMELKQEIEYLKSALMEEIETRCITQLRSPCEKPRVRGERSPLISRRLILENSESIRTESYPNHHYQDQKQQQTRPLRNHSGVILIKPGKLEQVYPEKPTIPRPRRLSIENPMITRSEKPQKPKEPKSPCEITMFEGSVPRTRRSSIENPMITRSYRAHKPKEPKSPNDIKRGAKKRTPPLLRRLSIENPNSSKPDGYMSKTEAPKSPLTSGHQHQVMSFTDCAVKFPSVQPPRTPEHSGVRITKDSKTPSIAKSTDGKGSQLRKSLRTIGKLINGSEKKNQQNRNDALSTKQNPQLEQES